MKINSLHIYTTLAFGMLTAFMIAPAISYRTGLPRIDNPLVLLFIICTGVIFFLENKNFPRRTAIPLISLAVMSGWSLLHLIITPLNDTRFADITLFAILPCYFYILYLVISRHKEPLKFTRQFLGVFFLFVAAPALIELFTGFQFVFSDETLSIESGTLKGLFFNPNNLATTALCLTCGISFFFNLLAEKKRDIVIGWLLFTILGVVIFASVSRTAIAGYCLLLFAMLIYRNNPIATILVLLIAGIGISMIPPTAVQNFLLSLSGNQFLERFSTRIYLFLYNMEGDNSVSYRQEIYRYFWNHPPLTLTGFGPKNFQNYFGGEISDSLAFQNPHSFLIELYLSFGIISMLGFICYVVSYLSACLSCRWFDSKQRVITTLIMVLFLVAGFIPSTILRIPFIWLPSFLILLYVTCNQNRSETTGNPL